MVYISVIGSLMETMRPFPAAFAQAGNNLGSGEVCMEKDRDHPIGNTLKQLVHNTLEYAQ